MSRWIRTADVAKLVRQELRTNWHSKRAGVPNGYAYSVRSETYAGGSAVRVTVPKDCPEAVERGLRRRLSTWGSAGFDGMTDSSYSKSHHLCPEHGVTLTYVGSHWGAPESHSDPCCGAAEPVHLGASYVTVSRDWR